jgi:hypothetical protein
LKAQLESQQPLRNEASILLDQSLRALTVTDEKHIRETFANFDDRWSSLITAVAQTELSTYQGEETVSSSVGERLESMGQELEQMKELMTEMIVRVETEDDLYTYLEKLQV